MAEYWTPINGFRDGRDSHTASASVLPSQEEPEAPIAPTAMDMEDDPKPAKKMVRKSTKKAIPKPIEEVVPKPIEEAVPSGPTKEEDPKPTKEASSKTTEVAVPKPIKKTVRKYARKLSIPESTEASVPKPTEDTVSEPPSMIVRIVLKSAGKIIPKTTDGSTVPPLVASTKNGASNVVGKPVDGEPMTACRSSPRPSTSLPRSPPY